MQQERMSESKSEPITFDALQASAERIVRDYWQREVVIAQAQLLTEAERRNRVWRCTLQWASHRADQPDSVIIKQVAPANYAPDDDENPDTQRFFGDWAGAAFLSQLGNAEGNDSQGPKFFGGDRAAGFVIIEDMGEHHSLVEPLLEGNATSAANALRAYTERLGKMHAAAYGRQADFDAIRRTLHPRLVDQKTDGRVSLQQRQNQITETNIRLSQLGLVLSDAALAEVNAIFDAVYMPDQFLTFIHADPCPDNVFYNGDTLRLIDFEFGHYGHALRDALYTRIPFPTCWCSKRVPSELVKELEDQYRRIFGVVCPAILDDAVFNAEVATVAGSWAINCLESVNELMEQDWQWGIMGRRGRILARLETFVAAADTAKQWPALRDNCARIHAALLQHWPGEMGQPLYPAFL